MCVRLISHGSKIHFVEEIQAFWKTQGSYSSCWLFSVQLPGTWNPRLLCPSEPLKPLSVKTLDRLLLVSRWSDAEMTRRENAGEQSSAVHLYLSLPSQLAVSLGLADQCCSFTVKGSLLLRLSSPQDSLTPCDSPIFTVLNAFFYYVKKNVCHRFCWMEISLSLSFALRPRTLSFQHL